MIDTISKSKMLAPTSLQPVSPLNEAIMANHNPLGRRGIERLDLLLLLVESLDLNGSQALLWTSKKIGLGERFPNSVELWKRRCHNPLRRSTRRGELTIEDSEALILLLCSMADRIYPLLHQLLSSREPEEINRKRWNMLHDRLNELMKERMNNRRGAVQKFMIPAYSRAMHRHLVLTLALCAGPGGVDRLRASLLDPAP